MIRLIFTSCISLVLLAKGFAQNDTSLKRNDSLVVSTAIIDTLQKSYDTSLAIRNINARQVNGPIYKLNLAVDIPVTAIAAGWSLFAFPKIYDKNGISPAEVLLRQNNKTSINGFDRWAADVYHSGADKSSDYFFYAAIPFPLVLLIDKDIRKDAWKVYFLYLETMSITGVFYTGSAYLWDRFRPLVYNSKAPMSERTAGSARNSFLAGHPALVATSSFFVASVYDSYHPDSKFKYVLYGAAAVVTGGTAYLRHRGGKHFPSDLLVGTTIGTLSGLLVPRLHKNKAYANSKVRIMPFTGESHGLYVTYKL